jgi:hypothetical protein
MIPQSRDVTNVISTRICCQKCGNNPVLAIIAMDAEDESVSFVILWEDEFVASCLESGLFQ